MLQVLRLPRKTRRRPKASLVARLPPTSMMVLQVLLLPRKKNLRCSECCACHAKRAGDAPSAAPDAQYKAAPKSITRRQTSADLYEGALSAAPATQKLRVLHLPCTCHAKRAGGAPCAAHDTPNDLEMLQELCLPRKTRGRPKASLVARCACHAKRASGAPSAAPATQNEPEVLQVLRLPRRRRRRPKASLVAGFPLTSMKVLQALRLPRKTSRRCSKCCA